MAENSENEERQLTDGVNEKDLDIICVIMLKIRLSGLSLLHNSGVNRDPNLGFCFKISTKKGFLVYFQSKINERKVYENASYP